MSLVDYFSERSTAVVAAVAACFALSACGTIPTRVVTQSVNRDIVGVKQEIKRGVKEVFRPTACQNETGIPTYANSPAECPSARNGLAAPRPRQ